MNKKTYYVQFHTWYHSVEGDYFAGPYPTQREATSAMQTALMHGCVQKGVYPSYYMEAIYIDGIVSSENNAMYPENMVTNIPHDDVELNKFLEVGQ